MNKARAFNPFLCAKSDKLLALIAEVQTQMSGYEAYYGTRKRARRPADQVTYDRTVEAVQCLTARCWAGNKPQLFFCRDNRQRSSCSMDVLSRQHIFHGVDGNLVFLNEPGKTTRASPEDCYVVAKVKLARPGQSAFIAFSEQIIS